MAPPLVTLDHVRKWYMLGRGLLAGSGDVIRAVDDVSFSIGQGEILGLVGESGSGKSTVGRTILRLETPTDGRIDFAGQDITRLSRAKLRPLRRRMQLVFQDPFGSLNPRMTVGQILATPLRVHEPALAAGGRRAKIEEALATVGLAPRHAERFPHEFSGGQRQRIGLARALIVHPEFLIADEPVSALDVSIQAQILNLLLEIKRRLGLTILFITHDLAVVAYVADRIAVMYLGRIVELAPTRALFGDPRHPYTEALLSAVPVVDPGRRRQRIVLAGDVPSPIAPPSGCAFRTRCRYALPACAEAVPPLRDVGPGHQTACIRDDIALAALSRPLPALVTGELP
jgi:oligopeptide/dipeptide ABC transporter ATP-binding protein